MSKTQNIINLNIRKRTALLLFFATYSDILVFLSIFLVILWLNLHRNSFIFYHDADVYWNLRLMFDQQKTQPFSFLNYNTPLRGYLLPFIHYIISRIAEYLNISSLIFLEIVQAVVYGGLISLLFPRIITMLFQRRVKYWQTLVFSLLVIFFWHGYFFYPVSDFWAVFLFALGSYLILRYYSIWWALIPAGICFGGVVIIRPVYQIILLPLLLWIAYFYLREFALKARSVLWNLISVIIGIVIVFIPQTTININRFGIFSPFVQTQLIYGKDLFSQQLTWGTLIQKYETNVGTSYPSAAVFFVDKQGENLLFEAGYKPFPDPTKRNILLDRTLSLQQYLELVLKYPLDFIGIYARHLFNGLDIIYNTIFIDDIYNKSIVLQLTNYSSWFLVLAYTTANLLNIKRSFRSQLFLPVIFALPALLSIPTAIEVRFMLPVHLMAYMLIAFWILPNFMKIDSVQKRNLLSKYAIWYVTFIALCFMLSSNTYMGLQYGTSVLNGK